MHARRQACPRDWPHTLCRRDDDDVAEFTITPNTLVRSPESSCPVSKPLAHVAVLTACMQWTKLPERYAQRLGKPIVRSRKHTPNTTNPFPLTRLYGTSNAIFEVLHVLHGRGEG